MVGSDKRCRKIYRWLWYMSKNEESDRSISGEVEVEWSIRKTANISNDIFHHKVAVGSWKGCDSDSIW